MLAVDHPLSKELMKSKFHENPNIRELVIRLDIMMTSIKFAKLCHSASFMIPFYDLSNQTKIGFAKRNGLSQNLSKLIENFSLTAISLKETVEDILKDIIENLLLNILNHSSEEYCEFLISKLLVTNLTVETFFNILDQAPIEDGAKSQLARIFEIVRGEFKNYDIKQILRVMCTTESLRDSTEDIDKLDAAQSIQSISNYIRQLLIVVKNELNNTTDKLLLKSIDDYKPQTPNPHWRDLLEVKAHNIPTLTELERNQHTILIFRDIININKENLTKNLSDAHLLRINFSLKQAPNNRTILEEAESRDPEVYKLVALAAARQIILAQSKGLEGILKETKETIPDLIYRLMILAKTPTEKQLISDLTNGVLTTEKLEAESSRSLMSLFTDFKKYEWIQTTFSWTRLEPLITKLEDINLYLKNIRELRPALFNLFYSPTTIRKCVLMRISPSQLCDLYLEKREEYNIFTNNTLNAVYQSGATFNALLELRNQNRYKFEILTTNPTALEGYKTKYWSFKELNELNLETITQLLKPEAIVCIKAGFSVCDIKNSFTKSKSDDLYSERMQALLKIGATKNIILLLKEHKPLMLESLLSQSKKALAEGKSFSDLYFYQGQGFMNQRTNPLPVVAGAGALLYRPDSPGINFAILLNRAVSRIDLENANSSPKPRRVQSTPSLQETRQTDVQPHTI